MKRTIAVLLIILLLAACSPFESIPYTPAQTPGTWLTMQPIAHLQLGGQSIVITQPSTSAIVYLLGLITLGAGFYFLRIRAGQRARLWWGIALLLWGLGALLAGTSYEAFSYQIKCAGRPACIWTSWWEIAYLFVSVASLDAILMAQAHSSAAGKWRRLLSIYAALNLALYSIVLLIGSFTPVKFLISFELLLVFGAPNIVIFIIQNSLRYKKHRRSLDAALLGAWVWLILTIAAYFLYLLSGLTAQLWAQGYWFSENDVLHIGLILWMIYLARVVAPRVQDEQTTHS